jgi:Rieske Fe-S protein
VLLGASALGAGGVLAACGASPSPNPGPASPAPQAPLPGAATTGPLEVPAAEIPIGGGKVFPDSRTVVTQPNAQEFRAFDATCQHLGCIVGTVSDGLITCPCHGSQYRITDGSVARGPNTGEPLTRGLQTKTATVTGDRIVVT